MEFIIIDIFFVLLLIDSGICLIENKSIFYTYIKRIVFAHIHRIQRISTLTYYLCYLVLSIRYSHPSIQLEREARNTNNIK